MSPSRAPVLSFARYFQAPATQASCNLCLLGSTFSLFWPFNPHSIIEVQFYFGLNDDGGGGGGDGDDHDNDDDDY